MSGAPKMTVVVRADLSDAQQAVQGMHALRQFVAEHPEADQHWFRTSNTLAFLAVPNEEALARLLARAADRGIRSAIYEEPDIGNKLTAACFEPGPNTRRLCGHLPKALPGR
jgi:peptidyl-tRNA hydrolase